MEPNIAKVEISRRQALTAIVMSAVAFLGTACGIRPPQTQTPVATYEDPNIRLTPEEEDIIKRKAEGHMANVKFLMSYLVKPAVTHNQFTYSQPLLEGLRAEIKDKERFPSADYYLQSTARTGFNNGLQLDIAGRYQPDGTPIRSAVNLIIPNKYVSLPTAPALQDALKGSLDKETAASRLKAIASELFVLPANMKWQENPLTFVNNLQNPAEELDREDQGKLAGEAIAPDGRGFILRGVLGTNGGQITIQIVENPKPR